MPDNIQDERYLQIILNSLNVCKTYKPKFGTGADTSLEQFRAMYRRDPFYSWFGLDNPLMYAAHKAAGGITSIYRQIGIGCENLFRQLIIDELGLTVEQANWSYEYITDRGKTRILSLDARIASHHVQSETRKQAISSWVNRAAERVQVDPDIRAVLKGAVFEIRQGYKSKDSKRQNADIANAVSAYKSGYLPVITVLSTQIDGDIARRYEDAGLLVLYGTTDGSPLQSTYAFLRDVIGYDLANFFARNSDELRETVDEIVEALLSAKSD